jgi:hypothetical protein
MPIRHEGANNTALAREGPIRYYVLPASSIVEPMTTNVTTARWAKRTFQSPIVHMPKYVIEREIAGAGKLTSNQLQDIAQKSCGVLQTLGPKIQWVQSSVTNDKLYCIYIAPDEATVLEHARLGGFPANRVSKVKTIIDPTTAEA